LEIKDQAYPTRPDEMEQFFLSEISQAETLNAQGINLVEIELMIGPAMYLSAAQHFYKALKVYPNTAELLEIYRKTVSEVVTFGFALIVGCIQHHYWSQRGGGCRLSHSHCSRNGLIEQKVKSGYFVEP
jgi:MAS20 protein import receptor